MQRRTVRSPSLIGFIAGLRKGPYASKGAICEEMRKYVEFDALSDWQVKRYVEKAIELKIVDDTKRDFFINQKTDVALTRKPEVKVSQEPEIAPEKAIQAAQVQQGMVFPARKEIDKTEAEKSWCHVVEGVKRERERLASVLTHCRIEWMGGNHVLVIFLPAVLAQWMNFVQSTENWGLISRAVQDRFSRDTAIRFMLDNGLRI